jgi:hypothetical protein
MQKIFNNILVPVAIGRKTEQTIETAIAFANRLGCNLHLLFIEKKSLFPLFEKSKNNAATKARIHELREQFAPDMKDDLRLFTAFQNKGMQNAVMRYAQLYEIDMIIAGREWRRYGFNDNRDDAIFHCPIVTIPNETYLRQWKIIVLPIENFLPVNKIRVAVCLARHFEATIHLVVMERSNSCDCIDCMKKAFRVLKDNTGLPVVCNVIPGKELGQVVRQYARSVRAGLILMNPGSMTIGHGLLSRLFPGWIKDEVKAPVIKMG